MKSTEEVNHPDHYGGDTQYEVIKVLEAWDPLMAYHFCIGNTIKYQARVGKKPGTTALKDLQKAKWYAAKAEEIYKRMDPRDPIEQRYPKLPE